MLRDLNLSVADRLASALVAVGLSTLAARLFFPIPLGIGRAWVVLALALDAPLLAFFARGVSPAYVPVTAVFQLLHRVSGLAWFAIGLALPALPKRRPSP
ncbi:MAG TPA: hypothetical protein VKA01_02870 [Vicinamibacteria bacterium]|nr:hypothetical protein [Vicinamibacteria bacterium]